MLVLGKDGPVLELDTASRAVMGWVPQAAGSAPGLEGRCPDGEGLGEVLGEIPRVAVPEGAPGRYREQSRQTRALTSLVLLHCARARRLCQGEGEPTHE